MKNVEVKLLEVHTPGLTVEYDILGGIDIKIGDFTYVHINYDYRYTNNANRSALADHIVDYLGGVREPVIWKASDSQETSPPEPLAFLEHLPK